MNKKQLKRLITKIIKHIGGGGLDDSIYNLIIKGDTYNLINEKIGSWFTEDDGSEYRQIICEITKNCIPTRLFLSQYQIRTGSYNTDWEYSYEKIEVVKKIKKIHIITNYDTVEM